MTNLPNAAEEPSFISGVDASHYQAKVDWWAVKESGVQFAFIKATEGRTYVDKTFASKWAALSEVGLLRGAYHVLRPDNNRAVQEADHAMSIIGEPAPGDLPIVADLEIGDPKMGPEQLADWVNVWCHEIEALSGRAPIVYLYPSYWQVQLGRTQDLQQWTLWLADYRHKNPSQPAADLGDWKWKFWQWTESGIVPGYAGDMDRNVYRGCESSLYALANA